MSCDKLVYDLSQEVEGSPNVFIRKDWLNILDNQNTNYQNNQSIIDTSQLSNSNKYMAYREGYLSVPMLLSARAAFNNAGGLVFKDYSLGLKNWFGTIIHSLTLDYNGTTIIQQTPLCNLWNSFKLLTTLSWNDVSTIGSSIGFYPDVPDSFQFDLANLNKSSLGINNNVLGQVFTSATGTLSQNIFTQQNGEIGGNIGATFRTKWIAYNPSAPLGSGATYANLLPAQSCKNIWKSYISTTQASAAAVNPISAISIMGVIYLKHIHSFFNMVPLLKGVFMKLTLNLNNASTSITYTKADDAGTFLQCTNSTVYVGGVQPILVPSTKAGFGFSPDPAAGVYNVFFDLTVGATCNNTDITTGGAVAGTLSKSVYLYVPAYTFNPTFEQAYLSQNIKQIKYTDIYQYQITGANAISPNGQFNNLITNGIANIKSVLILPFYSTTMAIGSQPVIEYLSPFDTAGGGTCAPMASINNFNVQIAGQNAIYNMQKYTFEEWVNQLNGCNAVNGGLTDGLTSGLIDFLGFSTSYPFYYVNVERMLPVEQSVPKSVQILGTNQNALPLNLIIFIEYGVQISIDVLTGARV